MSQPLKLIGLNLTATATLAGVIVSALGALLAMLALYDLTSDSLGDEGAMRAAFYLLIFPTGFFLVQVYTEGLFVGLGIQLPGHAKTGKMAAGCAAGGSRHPDACCRSGADHPDGAHLVPHR